MGKVILHHKKFNYRAIQSGLKNSNTIDRVGERLTYTDILGSPYKNQENSPLNALHD